MMAFLNMQKQYCFMMFITAKPADLFKHNANGRKYTILQRRMQLVRRYPMTIQND